MAKLRAITGSTLTRAEMHAYYIAVVTMPRLVFNRDQLERQL